MSQMDCRVTLNLMSNVKELCSFFDR